MIVNNAGPERQSNSQNGTNADKMEVFRVESEKKISIFIPITCLQDFYKYYESPFVEEYTSFGDKKCPCVTTSSKRASMVV